MNTASAVVVVAAAITLSGCSGIVTPTTTATTLGGASTVAAPPSSGDDASGAAGLPNPASVYCLQRGGSEETKTDDQGGQFALCHLPDGSVVDEWELFRKNH